MDIAHAGLSFAFPLDCGARISHTSPALIPTDSILPLALCHHSQREDHKKSADEYTDSAFHFHLPSLGNNSASIILQLSRLSNVKRQRPPTGHTSITT